MLASFKYLGQVISATDDNWPEVVRNLDRANKVWSRMSRILSRERAVPRVSGFFFKAVIQAVMLFRAETWVVTYRMGKALGRFHTQVTRRLMVQLPHRTTDGKWRYTLAAASREEAGFLTMEEYVRHRQNTVVQYIATRSLLDLCEGSERAPGAQVSMRWWEQEVIYMAGVQEAESAVEEYEGVEE